MFTTLFQNALANQKCQMDSVAFKNMLRSIRLRYEYCESNYFPEIAQEKFTEKNVSED